LLTLRVQPRLPGERAHQAVARAQAGEEIQASGTVVVSGEPALALSLSDRDDALEVGKETIYEIRVSNQGTAADTEVQVRVELPAGLAVSGVSGPTAHRLEGRTLVFAPLAKLEPQRQAVYQLRARAQAPGTMRVRALASSTHLRTPLSREQRTLVYPD
jgi:hypothetical protein